MGLQGPEMVLQGPAATLQLCSTDVTMQRLHQPSDIIRVKLGVHAWWKWKRGGIEALATITSEMSRNDTVNVSDIPVDLEDCHV